MINARKLNNEKNIFSDLFKNYFFVGIWFIIVAGQILIIEVGSRAMKVSPGGLPWEHWLIAIAFGLC